MEKYLKNKKVKMRFKEDIELQEVLLDSLAQKKEAERLEKERERAEEETRKAEEQLRDAGGEEEND